MTISSRQVAHSLQVTLDLVAAAARTTAAAARRPAALASLPARAVRAFRRDQQPAPQLPGVMDESPTAERAADEGPVATVRQLRPQDRGAAAEEPVVGASTDEVSAAGGAGAATDGEEPNPLGIPAAALETEPAEDTVVDRDELPLPDYDHLTLASLRGRMRSLDLDALGQIRDYERTHAHRLPILTMIENRIAKLSAGEAQPAGGQQGPPQSRVDQPPAPAGGSPVTPATAGPPLNPPAQGVTANPAQPR